MGLAAPWHAGSSQTRARTRVPCIGRQILNHCATREALIHLLKTSQDTHLFLQTSFQGPANDPHPFEVRLVTFCLHLQTLSAFHMIHVRKFTTNPADFLVPGPLDPPAHRISVEIHKALLKQKGNTVWRDISTDKEENFWVKVSTRFSQLAKIVAVF